MQLKIENLKRSFHVSQLIYKEYSNMFGKLFKCTDAGEEQAVTKSRKKSKWDSRQIMINDLV